MELKEMDIITRNWVDSAQDRALNLRTLKAKELVQCCHISQCIFFIYSSYFPVQTRVLSLLDQRKSAICNSTAQVRLQVRNYTTCGGVAVECTDPQFLIRVLSTPSPLYLNSLGKKQGRMKLQIHRKLSFLALFVLFRTPCLKLNLALT